VGEEIYLDATKVAANAALASLQPRFTVEAHLAHLFAAESEGNGDARSRNPDGESGDEPVRLPVTLIETAQAALGESAARRHHWIAAVGRPERTLTRGTSRRTAGFRVSTTDSYGIRVDTRHSLGGTRLATSGSGCAPGGGRDQPPGSGSA
jgi:hypothetical protein